MINYVMVGTNRFESAVEFYEALMTDMGATRVYATEQSVAWGWGIGTPMFIVTRPYDRQRASIGNGFIVTRPYDRQRASIGNGSMVAFDVESAERVDALHAKALALGASSEGDPGPRGEQLYVGYWRDLDGNKFNFICYRQQA